MDSVLKSTKWPCAVCTFKSPHQWNHTRVFDSSRNTHRKILLPAKFTQIFLSIQPRTESTRCSVRQMLCRMCQHWSAALFCMTSLPAFINPLVNFTKWQTSNRFSLNISCDSLIGYNFKTAEKLAQYFDKCFCLISIEIGADNSDQAIEPNFIVEIHRLAYILFSIENIHVKRILFSFHEKWNNTDTLLSTR